jgi:hypothetical protein
MAQRKTRKPIRDYGHVLQVKGELDVKERGGSLNQTGDAQEQGSEINPAASHAPPDHSIDIKGREKQSERTY